ncbi:MAG: DNA polymerase III subunit beta, partial [Candidatus Binataceae bacterium]
LKLGFAEGVLTVSSTSPELGEASETIDVDFSGEEFSIGFNAAYLLEVLNVIDSEDEVVLGVSDEVSPGVITTNTDSQFTYVVMPMRL